MSNVKSVQMWKRIYESMLNAKKKKAVRIYLVTMCKSGFITFYKKGIRIFQEVQKI